MTGEDLVVGQKVYIFYKYGDLEQGWIMIKWGKEIKLYGNLFEFA
jgi:hypothetical protein